jgi:acyl-CoA synthetase (AMP-forming)/AMP-acid ligase II
MASAPSRIKAILNHLIPTTGSSDPPPHIHHLSPTFFLPRAASIEPKADAVYHINAANATVRRNYAQTADRARGLAYYFKKHGFKRVGIVAPNTPAFLEAIYAIPAAGGVVVPVNYRLKPDDITYILTYADVDCVLVDDEFVPLLDDLRAKHPNIPLLVDQDRSTSDDDPQGPYDEAIQEGYAYDREQGGHGWDKLHHHADNEDDMIAIPFTSGTTSRPKGVIYTHRGAYLAAMGNIIESELIGGQCRYLWTLPMFHAMGWTFVWSGVAQRGLNVCLRKIDYPLIWKLLKELKITHFNAAPTVNTLLVAAKEAEPLPNPVRVTVAASPPTAYLFSQMAKFNLQPVHVYGLTETYGPLTKSYYMPEWEKLSDAERLAKMARQGHGFITSLPIRIVKQDQPEGVLIDVEKNGKEIGEIVFFGNGCAKGYYKDPEATRKLFAGGGLHSGDLAVWHPDGSAQIFDRAKDIIISGGENISSVALESMLVEHPDILEAGVVAVVHEKWGEVPKAYITVKEGKNLTGDDVIAWAKSESRISSFMVPKEVRVVKELPKTSTGKIRKNDLRDLDEDAS